jgi:uncharacterized membrane protein YGL010W
MINAYRCTEESNMKTLSEYLSQYAAYHRDPRNVTTHLVGIPLIVLSGCVLLSRPVLAAGGYALSPAVAVALCMLAFYFALDVGFGLIMTGFLALALTCAAWVAAQSTGLWLTLGVGGFVLGWVIQFIGHYYEGRKPAFLDDLTGLLIGPLFVLAEVLLRCGLRRELRPAVHPRTDEGPTG